MKKLLISLCLIALLTCCGGGVYMPENVVVYIYAYDKNTNGIAGLKVTFTLTTNGITDTDIKYTDTNGEAESKVFNVDFRALKLDDKPAYEKLRIFQTKIEDIDGTNNGGEFLNTNIVHEYFGMKIFMQTK